MSDLNAEEIWRHSRDSINLVAGAILGAYLGLTISRDGLTRGTNLDLFALITMTAFTVVAVVNAGNNWFSRNIRVAAISFVTFPVMAWISTIFADNLGINIQILVVIYVAWVWLIVMQIFAFESASYLSRKLK